MDFRTVLRTIASRWQLVVFAMVACLAGALAITMAQTKTYQASATILVSVSGAVTVNDAYEATQAAQQRLSSYAEIAGGRTVAQRAIDELDAPISPEQLMDSTKVSYTPLSTLFQLTVTDTDPQRAAALAQAMADQFAALVPEVDPGVELNETPSTGAGIGIDGQQRAAIAKATVVEQPIVPQDPVSPVPARNLTLGLLAGLLLGISIALVRNATDRTVRGSDGLATSSGVPTLAELPPPDDSIFDEAMSGLRNRLTGATTAQAQSLLVTAPTVGQGATTTALNLARSFADVDETVLLVDGDANLADLVTGDLIIEDAVVPTAYSGLSALASAPTTKSRRQLSTTSLAAALKKLCANFDRVVIDGPPAVVGADAAAFAAAVDATVLVVRCGKTTVDEVERSLENLRAAGGKVVGTVLTDISVPRRTKAAMVAYQEKVGDTDHSDDHTADA